MAVAGVAGRIVDYCLRAGANKRTANDTRTKDGSAQERQPSGPLGDGKRSTMAPRPRTGRATGPNR